MTSTDIVTARPMSVPVGHEVDALARIATNLAAAGIYRKTASSPEAVFAILLAARDLGVSATGALAGGIHMVEGKPEVSANLQAQLLREYRGPEGQRYDFRVLTPARERSKECHIEFKRLERGDHWEVIGEEIFTWDDATRAQLAGKDNYKKYPKMMLLARCLSDGIASHCPETARGLRVYGESEIGGAPPPAPLDSEPDPRSPGPVPVAGPEHVDGTVADDDIPAAYDPHDPTVPEPTSTVAVDRALDHFLRSEDDLSPLRSAADAGMRALNAPAHQRLSELQKAETEEALEALIARISAAMPTPEVNANGASA